MKLALANPWKNKERVGEFYSHNNITVWKTSNKEKPWRHIFVSFGIRRSRKWQIFPIWLTGHNNQKSVMFGFWKFYFEVGYRY